jgi:hypothetical protein
MHAPQEIRTFFVTFVDNFPKDRAHVALKPGLFTILLVKKEKML